MFPPRPALNRLVRLGPLVLLSVSAGAACATTIPCVVHPSPGEAREVACPLDGTTARRPLRLVVDFAGSHDDTVLRLEATLDGRPLPCDTASKTSSRFEDGEIRLDCRFVVDRDRGQGPFVVGGALFVHHAQIVDARLVDD